MVKEAKKQAKQKSAADKVKDAAEAQAVKGELFLVLDIGTSLLKAGLVKTDTVNQQVFLLDYVQAAAPLGCFVNKDNFEMNALLAVIDSLVHQVQAKNNVKVERCLIGASANYLTGQIFDFSFQREKPREKIDLIELENIFIKTIRQVKEKIKDQLKDRSNQSVPHFLDVYLLNLNLDGYQIADPQGLTGQQLAGQFFNIYTKESFWQQWQKLMAFYKKKRISLMPGFWLVQDAVFKEDCLLIDIGHQNTEIILRKQGRLAGHLCFGIGGASFSYALAEALGVGHQEAEEIKLKYIHQELSPYVQSRLDKIFDPVLQSWLEGVFVGLKDINPNSLLPEEIYVFGGGVLLPTLIVKLQRVITQQDLAFLNKGNLSIQQLTVREIKGLRDIHHYLTDSQKISIGCLARAALYLGGENHSLRSLLKKAVKLNS